MVIETVVPCWRGNVDISALIELFCAEDDLELFRRQDGYLEGIKESASDFSL